MPAGGDINVGVGDFGVVLENAARACECEAGLEVPESVPIEVGACSCVLVGWVEITGIRTGNSQRKCTCQLASVAAMGV